MSRSLHDAIALVTVAALAAVVAFLCAWGWVGCLDHAPLMMGH